MTRILQLTFRWLPPLRGVVAWMVATGQMAAMARNLEAVNDMLAIQQMPEVVSNTNPVLSTSRTMFKARMEGILTMVNADLRLGWTVEELVYIDGHNVDRWMETFTKMQEVQ